MTGERMECEDKKVDEDDEQEEEDDEDENEDSDNDDPDEEDDDDEDAIRLEGTVEKDIEQFTFEFKDMHENFYSDIATLTATLVKQSGSYELSHAIADQCNVGTVIVCEEGDDVFAFASILPLSNYLHLEVINSIIRDISTELDNLDPEGMTATIMKSCIAGADTCLTGIMLQGRFMNLPLTLIPPLHRQLLVDVTWARDEEKKNKVDKNVFSKLEYVLLLSPCSRQVANGQEAQSPDITGDSSLLFDYFEDEIYFQESLASIMFKPKCAGVTFAVALVPLSSIDSCIESLKNMLST